MFKIFSHLAVYPGFTFQNVFCLIHQTDKTNAPPPPIQTYQSIDEGTMETLQMKYQTSDHPSQLLDQEIKERRLICYYKVLDKIQQTLVKLWKIFEQRARYEGQRKITIRMASRKESLQQFVVLHKITEHVCYGKLSTAEQIQDDCKFSYFYEPHKLQNNSLTHIFQLCFSNKLVPNFTTQVKARMCLKKKEQASSQYYTLIQILQKATTYCMCI